MLISTLPSEPMSIQFLRSSVCYLDSITFYLLKRLKSYIHYTSLLIPHLLYGIEIWYGIHQYNNDRVFKLQKKAIRAINCLSYNSHTNDYFKSMNLLKLEDMYKQRALFFYIQIHFNYNTPRYS